MKKMATIFDNPANDMEKDIAEHIKPLVTAEVEEKIKKDKLTLKGCCKFCMDKGKSRNCGGIAHIPDELHWKWVREYFGIQGKADISTAANASITETKPKPALDVDFDSLFD